MAHTTATGELPRDRANLIEVERISKCYRVAAQSVGRVSSFFMNRLVARKKMVDLWALKDVSFSVARGEVLGVLGTNGSGKSTLLRILNGISAPSMGDVRREGRIAALLDLTAGFHYALTGYENLFLSGSILGLSREQVRELLPGIMEFSGLSHTYMDSPVRYYSTGMVARLGFALSVSCDPDIILIDEVLAVGDSEFQARSARRLLNFRNEGKAMIMVSHAPPIVLDLATRVLWLHKGQMRGYGDPQTVVKDYQKYLNTRIERGERELALEHEIAEKQLSACCEFSDIELDQGTGTQQQCFHTNGTLRARVNMAVLYAPPGPAEVLVRVAHETGMVMDETTLAELGTAPDLSLPAKYNLQFTFAPLLLSRGTFTLTLMLVSREDINVVYATSEPATFRVDSSYVDYPHHLVELPCEVVVSA